MHAASGASASSDGSVEYPARRIQNDGGGEYVHALRVFERRYARRRRRFMMQRELEDTSTARLFVLSDDKPWEVFGCASSTPIQRRKLVFEAFAVFPVLHGVCANGDRTCVRSLLPAAREYEVERVCVLARDACGRVALHHAVVGERINITKRLLRRGDAKLQTLVRDNSQRTPLHYALQKMELLARAWCRRNKGTKTQRKFPVLVTAEMRIGCRRYRRLWELADRMLCLINREALQSNSSAGGEGGESIEEADVRCRGDVWDACRSGDLERLETLFRIYGPTSPGYELQSLKRTLLHEACEAQQAHVVDFLLSSREISVLARDSSGCTALHCAARRGFLDICQLLLAEERGSGGKNTSRLDVQDEEMEALALCQDLRGRTALHWCLLANTPPAIRSSVAIFLAEVCPSSLHVPDDDGVAPLHLAIERRDLELVQRFIYLGASVDAASGSDSLQADRTDSEEKKASWAPCGQVFQRRRRPCRGMEVRNTPNELASGPGNAVPPRKGVFKWNDIRHPVETLWYWSQQPNIARARSAKCSTHDEKLTDAMGQERNTANDDKGEELGCEKYGGVCDQCRPQRPLVGRSSCSPRYKHGVQTVLPPLVLALRMCRLRDNVSSVASRREAIVHFLLESGANPDGMDNDSYDESGPRHKSLRRASPLAESLQASVHCPQLLPTLLVYGAKRITVQELDWSISSIASRDKDSMEAALTRLLELEHLVKDRLCVLILFHLKYFRALLTLVEKLETMNDTTEDLRMSPTACNASDKCEHTRLSPWKVIRECLASRYYQSMCGVGRGGMHLETEHLIFLSSVAEQGRGRGCDSIRELFEYCVSEFLCQSALPSSFTRAYRLTSEQEIEEHEQVLLHCIRQLLVCMTDAGLKNASDKTATSAKLRAWLGYTMHLGCFQIALVLLETLVRRNHAHVSLDAVLDHYATAKAIRTHREDQQLRFHREFLSVCTEKLLFPSLTRLELRDLPPPPSVEVSMRSFVHLCAYDLPFAVVARCLHLVFHSFPKAGVSSNCAQVELMHSFRVEGRTVCDWVVIHGRLDIIELLLAHLPEGPERTRCWRCLVIAAAVACTDGSSSRTRLLKAAFALYSRIIAKYLSDSEQKALAVDLMLKVAIPLDSVALFRLVIDHLMLKTSPVEYADSVQNAVEELEVPGVVYVIARWNATKMAAFWLECSWSCDESGGTSSWRLKLLEHLQRQHTADNCTPLELSRLLGHNQLHHKFLCFIEAHIGKEVVDMTRKCQTASESSSSAGIYGLNSDTGVPAAPPFGLLRHIIYFNENSCQPQRDTNMDLCPTFKRSLTQDSDGHPPSVSTRFESACALNQVSHLRAMTMLKSPRASPNEPLSRLILSSVTHGSIDALRWLLAIYRDVIKTLPKSESAQCLQAAARHSSDTYAKMTLLLLESGLHPGRLAGDGVDTPLLHRVACFSNSNLARRAMTMLLARSDCDINALDAFGTPAVAYALALGCLENACFLIARPECRLEAEYEGQASFYYSLHLVPSFAARAVVRELLATKRSRAFLHCEADGTSCGCKGFEMATGSEQHGELATVVPRICGFCGHELSSHSLLPLPSWFRDQYDTYLGGRRAPQDSQTRSRSHSDTDCTANEDEDEEHQFGSEDAADEFALEARCGRLDVSLLFRIAAIRYDNLLQANELHLATPLNELSETEVLDTQRGEAIISEAHISADQRDDGDSVSYWPMLPRNTLVSAVGHCVDEENQASSSNTLFKPLDGFSTQFNASVTATCPWSLREELAMVHPPLCSCNSTVFATREAQLIHVVVCRWLRHTANSYTGVKRDPIPEVDEVLNHQHLDAAELTDDVDHDLTPVQVAFTHWRGQETAPQATNEGEDVAQAKGAANIDLSPDSRGVLRAAVAHWRYARGFSAFQRWKNYRSSAEVAHHRLATRLEKLAADMRHQRFLTLQLRQQQLHDAMHNLRLLSP